MLLTHMIIQKHIEKKIQRDYFFIEGVLEIDADYFLKKIDQGVQEKDNMNFKTAIKGKMTPYKYFLEDPIFVKLVNNFVDYLDENINLTRYQLGDAWGYKIGNQEHTTFHEHFPALWSGAIYLNDNEQILEFPEINKGVKPSVGKFVLFSSFLEHGCKKNMSNNLKYGLSFNMYNHNVFNE